MSLQRLSKININHRLLYFPLIVRACILFPSISLILLSFLDVQIHLLRNIAHLSELVFRILISVLDHLFILHSLTLALDALLLLFNHLHLLLQLMSSLEVKME